MQSPKLLSKVFIWSCWTNSMANVTSWSCQTLAEVAKLLDEVSKDTICRKSLQLKLPKSLPEITKTFNRNQWPKSSTSMVEVTIGLQLKSKKSTKFLVKVIALSHQSFIMMLQTKVNNWSCQSLVEVTKYLVKSPKSPTAAKVFSQSLQPKSSAKVFSQSLRLKLRSLQ